MGVSFHSTSFSIWATSVTSYLSIVSIDFSAVYTTGLVGAGDSGYFSNFPSLGKSFSSFGGLCSLGDFFGDTVLSRGLWALQEHNIFLAQIYLKGWRRCSTSKSMITPFLKFVVMSDSLAWARWTFADFIVPPGLELYKRGLIYDTRLGEARIGLFLPLLMRFVPDVEFFISEISARVFSLPLPSSEALSSCTFCLLFGDDYTKVVGLGDLIGDLLIFRTGNGYS